ncbi:pathogenesis-related homeodomain protein isoform X1 [Arachis duranensis]|uniref:Pathogenesis-related homeodomain protein isoform X1 n=3 Tax=Arachis TaxID=3817 RepID=A0A6P4DAT5_ARADU|nr:pathogenesis-related homeodomain protein isoform X1 [Arachis duranensis]XP_052118217.1 pathogenesis-related homeodomain protein isoform X1 [Arachis duranensis]
MRDTEKKLNKRGFRKSSHSREHTDSKLDLSPRFETSSNKGQGKKQKLKSKPHKLVVCTATSRGTATDSSSIKGSIKGASSEKLIVGQNMHYNDGKSLQMLSSTKQPGEKISFCPIVDRNDADGEVNIQKVKRRRRRKRRRDNVDLDDALRLQRRTRYLLIKMKVEQNLIDAYSGEGWKGQSREKIRPEKELQRAKKQILKCKLGIRDVICQLDALSSVGRIEDSVIAPDGSVYHEHIFCAKCKLPEAFPDNDIILCDGTCNRAFHQRCLDPPLDTENIPPGDQCWFCKFCECKMEILEATNAHLGTDFSLDSTWQDVFKEEATVPDDCAALLNPEEEWPSDDPEDDDYNPDRRENTHNINAEGTDESPSDSSSSISLSSLNDEYSPVDKAMSLEYLSVNSCVDSDGYGEIVCSRRQRKAVDYRKLYDEMFKDAPPCEQVSEDEDWGPGKRKRREKESDAANTLMTLHESDNKFPNNENNDTVREGTHTHIKRSCFRIPHHAVEKLRQVFADNELPPRSVKEHISKELGIDAAKVSKWFKNARYLALKTRKHQVEGGELPLSLLCKTSKGSSLQNVDKDEILQKSKASKIAMVHSPNNGNGITDRQKVKSSGSIWKKRQPEISPAKTAENGNKDLEEGSDDVGLKKLLQEKKRKMEFVFGGDSKAAELEFERLSKLKAKLDSMKVKLIEVQNHRAKGAKEPCVIYVPTAQLREKG